MTALLMSLLVGLLTAIAIYFILQARLVHLAIGLFILGHAINLFIFAIHPFEKGNAPIMNETATTLAAGTSDPLAQALILTAIVIGLGVQAFLVALLVKRQHS